MKSLALVAEPRAAKTETRSPVHIPELDGIRALAVWMVLCDHMVNGWPNAPGALESIPKLVLFVLGHGWLGVDLFFVLSGFLITGILVDARDTPYYFRNFYARRFLRIMPLFYLVLGVMWLCYDGGDRFFLISLLFLSNFNYFFGAPPPHGPAVFWSLAVEEHFYLVWPLLVRYLSRRALTWLGIAIVAGVPLLRFWAKARGMDPIGEIYSYTWFRIDGLAIGALLALWVRSRFVSVQNSLKLAAGLVVAALVLTVAGIPLGAMQSGSVLRYTQVQLVFAAFLLSAVALTGTLWTNPLRWGFLKLSGDLSYCIYLIHLGVGDAYVYLLTSQGILPQHIAGPIGSMLLRAAVVLSVTFGLAMLSQRYFERPILRLKRHFEYR